MSRLQTNAIRHLSAGSDNIVLDSAGRVLAANQPAFNAYNANTGSPVIWASTTVNRGNHYNTSTGKFTAPVAGVYLFYVSIHGSQAHGKTADFRLALNNGWISGGAACRVDTWYAQAAGTVVYSLVAGDTVHVAALASFTNDGGLSYFGGYLLG